MMDKIEAANRLAPLARALEIGRVVTDELLGGDPSGLRSAAKLRRLALDPSLPISESTLYRSVRVYEIVARRDGRTQGLGLGHFRAVIGLPGRHQDRLLAAAEYEGLDALELERRARMLRAKPPQKLKAPVRRLERMVSTLGRMDRAGDRRTLSLLRKIHERTAELLSQEGVAC